MINIQLRSIDNFSSLGLVANRLYLTNNLQLNSCCILNCWLKQNVVDENNLVIENNGADCSVLSSIKNVCEESMCIEKELILADLNTNNPINEQLQFSFIIFEDQPVIYTIYNVNEQVIRQGSVIGNKGFNSKTIDLPDVERGFYFLQIQDAHTKAVVKFMKL